MPKISEAGGPTDEAQPGYYEPGRSEQSPNVVDADEVRDGDDVSAGNSSPTSGGSTAKNGQSATGGDQSSARQTDGPSRKAPTGRSAARSTAGPGRAEQ
jgi:hypothetical protein